MKVFRFRYEKIHSFIKHARKLDLSQLNGMIKEELLKIRSGWVCYLFKNYIYVIPYGKANTKGFPYWVSEVTPLKKRPKDMSKREFLNRRKAWTQLKRKYPFYIHILTKELVTDILKKNNII